MTGMGSVTLPGTPIALPGLEARTVPAGFAFVDIIQDLLTPSGSVSVKNGLVTALLAGKTDAAADSTATVDTKPKDAAALPEAAVDVVPPATTLLLPGLVPQVAAMSGGSVTTGGNAAEIAIDWQNLPRGAARQPDSSLLSLLAARQTVMTAAVDALEARPAFDTDALIEATLPLASDKALETLARMSPGSQSAQPAQLALATPVTAREWPTDFSQRVLWMAGQRVQMAEIAVNPPNLGGIEVRLSMQDQGAGAQFFAASATVRDALDAALPRLRDMLAEAGISLLQAEVRDQAFSDRQPWQGDQGGDGVAALGKVHVLPLNGPRGQGLIDLYA